MRYDGITAGTVVTIVDDDIAADGLVYVGGIQMTADSTANTLTFVMPANNVTVSSANVPAAALIAVAYDEYVDFEDWNDGAGKAVVPVEIDGVYYVPAGTEVTVTVTGGGKFGTMPAANNAAGQKHLTTAGGNVYTSGDEITISAPYAIYAVTDVTTLANVTATYEKADGTDQAVTNAMSIVRGTVLDVAPTTGNGTGVIVGSTFGDDLNGKYTVGKDAVTLSAAVELTLNEGVSAVLKSDNTPVASGKYVKAGESNLLTITVDSDYGTAAIDLAQAGGLKHVDSSDAITGNMSTSTEDIDLYAAAQVNLEGTVANLYYVGTRNNITVADESYIISGVTLYSADATSVAQVDGGTVDYTTSEGELTFVTSNEDVNITNV